MKKTHQWIDYSKNVIIFDQISFLQIFFLLVSHPFSFTFVGNIGIDLYLENFNVDFLTVFKCVDQFLVK